MSEPELSILAADAGWPRIRTVGVDGYVVSFADALSEPANRAALAFRDALEKAGLEGLEETSTSLVSAYLRFDPVHIDHSMVHAALSTLLGDQDWYAASLPTGRRLWRIPVAFGGEFGSQLEDAAQLAGLDNDGAIRSVCNTRLRVQTIGFAPGMPYLGELDPQWDIPRQSELNNQVPAGGLCVAIRQLVLFPNKTPTGWRHIGQTALRLFRPDAPDPFLLRPGDEVLFFPVGAEEFSALVDDANGGAISEAAS